MPGQAQPYSGLTVGPELIPNEIIYGAGRGMATGQAVTSDGFYFYTVWSRGGDSIYLSRIDENGVLLDCDGILINPENQ